MTAPKKRRVGVGGENGRGKPAYTFLYQPAVNPELVQLGGRALMEMGTPDAEAELKRREVNRKAKKKARKLARGGK